MSNFIADQLDIFSMYPVNKYVLKEIKTENYVIPINHISKVAKIIRDNGEILYAAFHNIPHKYSDSQISYIDLKVYNNLVSSHFLVETINDFRCRDGILCFYKNGLSFYRYSQIYKVCKTYTLYGELHYSVFWSSISGNGGGCFGVETNVYDFLAAHGVNCLDHTPYTSYRSCKDAHKGLVKQNCCNDSSIFIPYDLMDHLLLYHTSSGVVIRKLLHYTSYHPNSVLGETWISDSEFDHLRHNGIYVEEVFENLKKTINGRNPINKTSEEAIDIDVDI